MTELPKAYIPKDAEERWYSFWEGHGYFHAKPESSKKPYTIVIPPPNITGILTMGHVLNNTIQDVFVRWRRMQGFETLWMPGTDHAGIATQNVVEKSLAKEGKSRHDLGRTEFLKRVWKWREEYGGTIIKQLRKLGTSCDWERERFTMDDGLSRAVQEIFVRLYDKGLIYRGKYIVNWCPKDHTAISDDEVNNIEHQGFLYYIKYPIKGTTDFAIVATTRPETILGDVAIAVHPDDERHKHLVGKSVILPLVQREIPVIEDTFVDPSFGTGMVKITPAHDPNDYWVGQRHHLDQINIFDISAKLNASVPEKYRGLDRFEARKIILQDLQNQELLEKTDQHTLSIGHCYRCDTIIEPYLSDQWFVKMKPLAEPALRVIQDGIIKFHPERWVKTYEHWMLNIRDWCISRQLWWGHRIPVWYCTESLTNDPRCKEPIVSRSAPSRCHICGSVKLRQDEDVLDTWFSSWLWPFSTLGWPEDNPELRYFYPTSTLVTAPDIIFFWVARMIMAGMEVMKDIPRYDGKKRESDEDLVPFRDVYFTSIIRDMKGRKMSKSLGNSPDPLDVIADYGADALRFTILYLAPLGQDVLYSNEKCEMGRNFANKVWNAGRFLLMNRNQLGIAIDKNISSTLDKEHLDLADKWILSRTNTTIATMNDALESFEINQASKILYDFIWHDFCDWYVEMVKGRLYGNEPDTVKHCVLSRTLSIFDQILRMLHPFMPFVTEELWHHLEQRTESESLMVSSFPKPDRGWVNTAIENEMTFVQSTINSIRNARGELLVPPSKEIELVLHFTEKANGEIVKKYQSYLQRLARVVKISDLTGDRKPQHAASLVVEGGEVFIPLEGLIDFAAERERIEKELLHVRSMFENTQKKLSNDSFTSKAPHDIVAKEREKLSSFRETIEKLQHNLERISS
jgi:valyl-tRNA synthetase